MNSLVKQKNTDFENYIMIAGGRDSWGVWDGHCHTLLYLKYTLLYLKWIINKDLLYITRNYAQCYVAAWMGGELGGEWIH